jgi:hypothetical protein
MLNKSISFQLLVVIFSVGLLTQCDALGKENFFKSTITTTGIVKVRPADEAKVEVLISDYEIKEATLEYLQSLPTPDFKLVFNPQDSFRTELPADVKSILEIHWKEAVKFFYEDRFNKQFTAQDNYKTWSNYCQKTEEKLQNLYIEAPNGRRKISITEADDLYGALNQAAVNIVDKAEKMK